MRISRRDLLGAAGVGAAALTATGTKVSAAPKTRSGRTLIRGADVLTMDPKTGELAGTDVLIVDGKIVEIGKSLSAADAEVIDAADMILMPGMVNGNTHLWLTVDAGSMVKLDYKGYLGYVDWKSRILPTLTPEDHYLSCLIGGLQAIDSGVTSVLDSPHGQYTMEQGLAAAEGARDSGVGGWCAFQLGVDVDYKAGDTVSRSAANSRYINFSREPHYAIAKAIRDKIFSDSSAPLQYGIAASIRWGQPMKYVEAEIARCRQTGAKLIEFVLGLKPVGALAPEGHLGTRGCGVADLYEAGLLGPDLHITHGTSYTDDELKMLADAGVMTCATAMGEINYSMKGLGVPNHGRARAAGIAAGVGMDVPNAVPQDWFEHIRTAYWSLYLTPEGRAVAEDYKSADSLDFMTGLGARAIRLGDVTGTISVGKRADLVLLRTDRFGFAMQGSLADRVANFAALQDIDSVWVMGMARKRKGKIIGHDLTLLKKRLAEAQARFRPLAATVKLVS
jgi:cytosine/adenosine deaminase-related metal-dependent hydrolase